MFTINVPNVLTLIRILLVPVLVVALLDQTSDGDVLAAIVFAIASLTDAIDGYLARSRNAITTFGKLMDPVADKLLIIAALFTLVSLDRVSAWVAMVIAVLIPLIPGIAEAGATLLDPQWLALGCAVGILSSAIPYSLETEALRRIPANVFGVLMSMEPAVAALAGFVVLGQDLGARELVAIGLVVAASAGVSIVTPPEA